MHIRFMIDVTCEDPEPSRVVPRIEGEIFDFVGEEEVMVGRIPWWNSSCSMMVAACAIGAGMWRPLSIARRR
jgi:hypothetical protein